MRVAHSYGSSQSAAPWCGTGFHHRLCRSSTSAEVRFPSGIERIRIAAYFDMSYYRYCLCAEESETSSETVTLPIHSKYPALESFHVEIFFLYPASAFLGVPTHSPFP